ncbi:MAG TPA: DUF3830 family protein [Herpetosiphonaceae bacterium]
MSKIRITLGDLEFMGRLEGLRAPATCDVFRSMLPYHTTIVHSCWSGEAGVILLGQDESRPQVENATSYPAPGDLLFYAGGQSEPKILFAYGSTQFGSKIGPLAGNHFLTIEGNRERLADVDQLLLWKGAQDISFELAD